jgi:hypothetical protein
MQLEEITLALFAASNGLRGLAYLPQNWKVATDQTGASALSATTWSLFLFANVSTVACALVNRHDLWLAACFFGNSVCCFSILGITIWKRRPRGRPGNSG